ncbi:hypothetical protein E4U55_001957 [Claviceps digitariae]|nr:hypothetical protein E4U55_001957 [Claviceps digitariae]
MQTIGSLLVSLVVASSLAAAAPASTNGDGTFSVPVEYNRNAGINGPAALVNIYRKYGKPVPAAISQAAERIARKGTGSVKNFPVTHEIEYLAPVEIGTPPQKLILNFDTGSSDLWVFSTETDKKEVAGQKLYNPHLSSTSKRLPGLEWNITYGDGSGSGGDVFTDVVNIGGLQVANQAVESAKYVSSMFTNDTGVSGMVGLAFSSINMVSPTPQKTFFENAKSSLREPLFTANLKHKADGTYKFGYIDPTEHTGDITYSPINSTTGFWWWESPGYAIGSGPFKNVPIPNIADTGSSLMILPNEITEDYYKAVHGSHQDPDTLNYMFPCDTKLPDFSFGVGGKATITVPGSYINYFTDDGKTCYGGIQPSGFLGMTILGDVAFKASLVVFDDGNQRIGWASKQL